MKKLRRSMKRYEKAGFATGAKWFRQFTLSAVAGSIPHDGA
jgi:hypothetical protein